MFLFHLSSVLFVLLLLLSVSDPEILSSLLLLLNVLLRLGAATLGCWEEEKEDEAEEVG